MLRQPVQGDAIAELEARLGLDEDRLEAAKALEPIYEEAKNWEGLRQVLEILAEAEHDPERRAGYWRRMAGIASRELNSPLLAFANLARAVRAQPGDAALRRELAELARASDSLEDFSELLAELAEGEGDPARALDLWAESAAAAPDPSAAAEAWGRVLELEPAHDEAFLHLQAHWESVGDLPALAQLLERRAGAVQSTALRADLLLQACDLLEERLGDGNAAIEVCRRATQGDAPDPLVEERLAQLLRRNLRFHELEALLRQRVQRAERAGAQREAHDALVELAWLRIWDAGDREEAAAIFSQVLAASPRHPAAIETLERLLEEKEPANRAFAARFLGAIHREERNHQQWVRMLHIVVEGSPDVAERAQCLSQAAEVYLGPLASPEQAFQAAAEALRLSPEDPGCLQLARQAAAAADRRDELLEVLDGCVAAAGKPEAKLSLLLAMADVSEESGDKIGALNVLRYARARAPADRGILERIIDLAAAAGDAGAHREALRARLALARDDEERVRWLRVIAQAEEAKGDKAAAYETWKSIHRLLPQDAEVLDRLAALSRSEENWSQLAWALERRMALPDPAALDACIELARLRAERLHDRDGATDLFEEALRRQPDAESALEGLELLFDADPTYHRAARILATLYREKGDIHELASLLDARAELAIDPAERRELLWELAELREQRQGRKDLAFLALARLFRETPADARLWPELGRLAEASEAKAEWLSLIEEGLAAMPSAEERSRFLLHLAEEGERRRDASALGWWERLLAEQPRSPEALHALESHYFRHEQWEALAGIVLRRAEDADSEEARLEIWRGLAGGSAWLRVHPHLFSLCEAQGRHAFLAELLQARIQHCADPRERSALLERLGELQQGALADPQAALETFRRLAEEDSANRRALEALRSLHAQRGEEEALAVVLERLLPLQESATATKRLYLELAELRLRRGEHALAVDQGRRALDLLPHGKEELERLRALFFEAEAHAEGIRCLELLAALAQGEEALALHVEIARIWEEVLGKKERGAPALAAVLELAPGNEEAFEKLREIYRAGADWRRYVQIAERYLEARDDGAWKVPLLRELATVYERKLGQRELALAKLGGALERDPENPEILAELQRLADSASLHEDLALLLETVAAGQEAPLALWMARGKLLDHPLDQAEEAEACFREVLSVAPEHDEAWAALIALFERRGMHEALVRALEQRAALAPSLEEKRALLLRVGELYAQSLQQPEAAIQSLQQAFELDPRDRAAFDALAALLRRERRWPQLAELLERSVAHAGEKGIRVGLLAELALILELELGDPERAATTYQRILDLDPGHAGALDSLERLFTALNRHSDLLVVYDRKIALVSEPEEIARLQLKAARIWEEKLANPEQALESLEAGLRAAPTSAPILRELVRLLAKLERWERLAALHEQRIAQAQGREALDPWLDLGEIRLRHLGQRERARAAYEAALELDPASTRALAALAAIHEEEGRWEEALRMLERQLANAVGFQIVEIHAKRGAILESGLGDLQAAAEAHQAALASEPGHLPSLQALARLQRQAGEEDALLATLAQLASYTKESVARARLYDEVGRLRLARGESAEGQRAYEEALRHDPQDREAARALAEIYLAKEDWERAEPVLDLLCSDHPVDGGEELRQHSFHLGMVAEKLGNRPKALAAYGRAYELDATFLPAAEALAHLQMQAGDLVQSLKTHQSILLHHRDTLRQEEVVLLHYNVGDLRARIGDPGSALASFQSALALDPWHLDSLRAATAMAEETGDAELALEYRKRLIEITEGEEKLSWLRSTARMLSEGARDPHAAISLWNEVLRLQPDDVEAMEALLERYQETGQAPKVLELLERMVQSESLLAHPDRGAKVHRMLAEAHLAGRHADDWLEKAHTHFNATLDLDWRQPETFSQLEKMLVEAQDWPRLQANYLRMIERLAGQEGTEAARSALYRTLGQLSLEILEQPRAAAQAFQAVLALQPDDRETLERYVDLVSQQRGEEEEAVQAWRRLLRLGGEPLPAAQSLVKLHGRRQAPDEAFVAAQVAVHLLGREGPDEKSVLGKLKAFARGTATRSLEAAHWKKLFHEQLEGPTASILALLHREAGHLFAQPLDRLSHEGRPLNLDPKRDRVALAETGVFWVEVWRYLARILALPLPEVYRSDQVSEVVVVNTAPLAFVVPAAALSERAPRKELFFHLGRALAFAKAELAPARLHSKEELENLVAAAISVAEPRFQARDEGLVVLRDKLAGALSSEARRELAELAAQSVGKRLSLRVYREGAEKTALRVGALLCADLQVAARLQAGSGDPKELAIFCLSAEFAELRRDLGLALHIPG